MQDLSDTASLHRRDLFPKKMLYKRENKYKNLTELEARLRTHILQIDVTGILNVELYEEETIFILVHSICMKKKSLNPPAGAT